MTSRNKGLDVLRAVAILMTFGRHMLQPTKELPPLAYKALWAWFKTGWAGVPLFFVLSGFLVSSLMFNEFRSTGGVRFGRFYIRRGLKIYPAFYALLACTLLAADLDGRWLHWGLVPSERITGTVILSEVFFLQNYLGSIWSHVWSLAIEEHFYLLLGLVFFLIIKLVPVFNPRTPPERRFAPFPWICVIVFVAALALRYFYLQQPRSMDERFAGLGYTHHRIDALLFGVLLAYYARCHAETFLPWVKRYSWGLFAAGIILIAPALKYEETDDIMFIYGITAMYVGFGCLLLFALYHPWKPAGGFIRRATDGLAYIGQNSYSIYLWHLPVMYVIGTHMNAAGKRYFLVIALQNIVGLIVGLVMARLIEIPVLNLRDRFFRPTKALSPSVPVESVSS